MPRKRETGRVSITIRKDTAQRLQQLQEELTARAGNKVSLDSAVNYMYGRTLRLARIAREMNDGTR